MIHVLCSMWGSKYNVEYVNTLYSMVTRHLPADFKFYCQTDQTNGLDSRIEVLPFLNELPESTPSDMIASEDFLNGLPRLWDRPKLNYFNPECWGLQGTKIAFDIDIIIQNDLSPILDLLADKPIVGRSWWHNQDHEKKPQWKKRYGALNNGGVYLWEGDMFKEIWADLKINWRKIYFCFHDGSDNFITNRHLDKFAFIPPSMYYSFNWGCKWPDDMDIHKIRDDKIICVFNTDAQKRVCTRLELHECIKLYPEVRELWQ